MAARLRRSRRQPCAPEPLPGRPPQNRCFGGFSVQQPDFPERNTKGFRHRIHPHHMRMNPVPEAFLYLYHKIHDGRNTNRTRRVSAAVHGSAPRIAGLSGGLYLSGIADALQEGHNLRAGAGTARRESIRRHAVGDAVLNSPEHRLIIEGSLCHVPERI